jgi:hypothetical protein
LHTRAWGSFFGRSRYGDSAADGCNL